MRWLVGTISAILTALICNLAWSGSHDLPFGWFLWYVPGIHAQQEPEVVYTPRSSDGALGFVDQGDGVRRIECEEDWYYTQATFLPDDDGDGWAELALAVRRASTCGNDVQGRLEILSGFSMTPIGVFSGSVDFHLERSDANDFLMLQYDGWGWKSAQVLDDLPSKERWRTGWGGWSLHGGRGPTFVGDVDGDGFHDMAVGNAFDSTRDRRDEWTGTVRVFSGRDGRPLWVCERSGANTCFGSGVAPAGDWNEDGTPDVAGLAHDSLCILSGRDGALLDELSFAAGQEMRDVTAVGDLDSDGRADFLLRGGSSSEGAHPVVYASGSRQPLDVTAGWDLVWAAANGDLDGDGRDDLVLGRIDPESGELRLSTFSQNALADVRSLGADGRAWDDVGQAEVGRFHEDGPWCASLTLLPPRGSFLSDGGTVLLVEGK